jgi:hypothetical protein
MTLVANGAKAGIAAGYFDRLPLGQAGALLVDPPWLFTTYSDKGRKKSADRHYRCMTVEEIKALPVATLCAPRLRPASLDHTGMRRDRDGRDERVGLPFRLYGQLGDAVEDRTQVAFRHRSHAAQRRRVLSGRQARTPAPQNTAASGT